MFRCDPVPPAPCEASGGYEALLLSLAHAVRRPIIQLNARQVRDFARAQNRLAKTDRIDAGLIADFAQTFQPEPLPPPDPLQEQLLALVKHRSHLLTPPFLPVIKQHPSIVSRLRCMDVIDLCL
jgi:transposase